jgi:uncharacterized membrane protein
MSTPNPYAAPRAPVSDLAGAQANFIPAGRGVPASHGWDWIAQGWDLFKRQPGIWVVQIIIFAVLYIVMALIPVLGSLAGVVFAPVFAAGFMIGCRALEEGQPLKVGHLFAGFRERFGTLVVVGVIYLAVSIVIALVVGLATGVGMWSLLGGGAADAASGAAAALTLLLALLVMLALMLPVMMAVWFAPALVLFHEQGAGEAMKNSFIACLKNILPFLIYGVILFVAAILASIPFALGFLVLGPVIVGSLYASYRDIFFQ